MWLHGAAGVGKSAMIQTFAESEANSPTSILGATIFYLKPSERDDHHRVTIILVYQRAVKCPENCVFVAELLRLNP